VLDIRDAKNQTQLKTKYSFLKSSNEQEIDEYTGDLSETFAAQFTNEAQLYAHLESMIPKAEVGESKTILNHLSSQSDIMELQSFFYNFWYKRNQFNPVAEWNSYYDQVLAVDKEFGTSVKEGHETDRGHIYLKYGAPNTRVRRPHETDNFVDLILNDLAVRALNPNADVTNTNSGNTNGTRFIIQDLYLNPR